MNASRSARSLVLSAALPVLVASAASAAPVVIEDFANAAGDPDFGSFTFRPNGSGTSTGLTAASTSTVPATAPFAAAPAGEAAFTNRLSIVDDPAVSGGTNFGVPAAWTVRHVSGGGSAGPLNTVTTGGGTGYVGYYLRTTDPDIFSAIALDEVGGSGGTEASTRTPVIADGEYHLYQYNLADAAQWDALFGGNGTLDGTSYSIDSIFFYNRGANDGETSVVDLAYLSFDAEGPLADLTVPEPASLALLAGSGLLLLRRRAA